MTWREKEGMCRNQENKDNRQNKQIPVLNVLRPVNSHIRVKQKINVFQPQVKILMSLLNTHSTVGDWRNLGKMKLNELGRHKLARQQPCIQQAQLTLYSDLLQAQKEGPTFPRGGVLWLQKLRGPLVEQGYNRNGITIGYTDEHDEYHITITF